MTVPDSIPPNQAPGGLVCIAFDLEENEVTRSVAAAERIGHDMNHPLIDWLAEDAGEAVHARGGGFMVAYDGDSGELMFRGPVVELDDDGFHLPVLHEIADLMPCRATTLIANNDRWPWMVVGVFPVEDDGSPTNAWWNWFCYTVGLGDFELFVPCSSIEGRGAGHDLITEFLNVIAAGMTMGIVQPLDSVRIPLGVPDADDIDTIWWIGEPVDNFHHRYPTYQSPCRIVVPILWSSGLGWK